MSLTLQFLNAREGDAIWVRWGDGRQIMIDMGTNGTGKVIDARLRALPESARAFELLVVTHVDADHIGGVMRCLVDAKKALPGLSFKDVWFNGWQHLKPAANGRLESQGPAQGEEFTTWLQGRSWNAHFGKAPVVRTDLRPVELGDGLSVRILGPSRERLAELAPVWQEAIEEAIAKGRLTRPPKGLESLGEKQRPDLADKEDLEALADTDSRLDAKPANGSSITLLLEWRHSPSSPPKRILLTGDAFAADVRDGLKALQKKGPVAIDLVKVPHHGSQQNVTRGLVEAIDCPLWLFSSDGTTHKHPDAEAVARVLRYGAHPHPSLAFTVRSKYSGWWDDSEWRGLFGYDACYGTIEDGLTVCFDDRGECVVS